MSDFSPLVLQTQGVIYIAWAGGVPSLLSIFGFPNAGGVPVITDIGVGAMSITFAGVAGGVPNNRFFPVIAIRTAAAMATVQWNEAASTDLVKDFRVSDAAGAPVDNIPFVVEYCRVIG